VERQKASKLPFWIAVRHYIWKRAREREEKERREGKRERVARNLHVG
jgi:hypothetical protein